MILTKFDYIEKLVIPLFCLKPLRVKILTVMDAVHVLRVHTIQAGHDIGWVKIFIDVWFAKEIKNVRFKLQKVHLSSETGGS